jgi:hypothetical protein
MRSTSYVRREDAERFVEETRSDEPELAKHPSLFQAKVFLFCKPEVAGSIPARSIAVTKAKPHS